MAPRGVNPLLRDAASEHPKWANWRVPVPTPQSIVVLFLTAHNFMYLSGFFIYASNEFIIARSFFTFSLLVNFIAYYGVWKRKAAPILPCLVVYSITLVVDMIMSSAVFFIVFATNYDEEASYVHDWTKLDYRWSRMLVRLTGYFSLCSAGVSIVYLMVLVGALAAIRKEYSRDRQVFDRSEADDKSLLSVGQIAREVLKELSMEKYKVRLGGSTTLLVASIVFCLVDGASASSVAESSLSLSNRAQFIAALLTGAGLLAVILWKGCRTAYAAVEPSPATHPADSVWLAWAELKMKEVAEGDKETHTAVAGKLVAFLDHGSNKYHERAWILLEKSMGESNRSQWTEWWDGNEERAAWWAKFHTGGEMGENGETARKKVLARFQGGDRG